MKGINGPWSALERFLELEKRGNGCGEAERLLGRYGVCWARTLSEYLEDSPREKESCICREIAERLEAEKS